MFLDRHIAAATDPALCPNCDWTGPAGRCHGYDVADELLRCPRCFAAVERAEGVRPGLLARLWHALTGRLARGS